MRAEVYIGSLGWFTKKLHHWTRH